MSLTWVEISAAALANNLKQFRRIAKGKLLAPVVKANAYGHGLIEASRVLADAGADWLCVNALYEAAALRTAGISVPLYVLGYVPPSDLEAALDLDCRLVVYHAETVRTLAQLARAKGKTARVHVKVETGNNRQGLALAQVIELARLILTLPAIELEGLSSHYADIEDTTDHAYAKSQLCRFNEACDALRELGLPPKVRNFSNSAAAILWNETHFELVRVGISMFGMWPSKETFVATVMARRRRPDLRPALTWKTVVAQVKKVYQGEFVGYGRTFQATHPTTIAVLPTGYYDGYDRGLSNLAHVLVNGQIAAVLGRVCMNMTMVDVSDIRGVKPGTEVVLLGRQGGSCVTAEQMADWIHSINYEVTTRINDRIPRVVVP